MVPPLDQHVLLMSELKGAHQAVVRLLLVSGWRFFPSGRGGSCIKALLFQLINLSDSGQNPLIHGCLGPPHVQGFCMLWEWNLLFLAGHREHLPCMDPLVPKESTGDSSAIS